MLNMVSWSFNLLHFIFQWANEFCLLSLPTPTENLPYPSGVYLKPAFTCSVFFLLLNQWIWIMRLRLARVRFVSLKNEAYLGSPAPFTRGHFPNPCHCPHCSGIIAQGSSNHSYVMPMQFSELRFHMSPPNSTWHSVWKKQSKSSVY